MTYFVLLIAIIAEVIATTALKASASFTRPVPSVIVVVGYGCAFYCLSLVLRQMSVGAAYAIWCGLGIAMISVSGFVVYGEKLDVAAWIGLGLIVVGVFVLCGFSSSALRH